MKTVSILAALVASAAALQITEPASGAQWDLSKTNTIKWTSVSTDPTEFQLVLVDKSSSTGEVQLKISDKVKTSDGKYDLTNFVAKAGDKYSIKAIALAQTNSGQLAESQTFNVTKSGTAPTNAGGGSNSPAASTTDPGASQPTKSGNAAAGLAQTFGVAGPLAVVLAMLF